MPLSAPNIVFRMRWMTGLALYMGVAPKANLISIEASDDDGNATVLDVIAGVQFAVDHKAEYNIRVLNLSVESTSIESYETDQLDAAVEAAWNKGIFVVAAAGNRGPGDDSVSQAPGNDPYVVTVGAVDDQGTKEISDDTPTSWSSRGTTRDGFAKPDVYAPGAHIVSNLAPKSKYAGLCGDCVSGDGEYIRAGGTSMAAPMVAGAAAIGFQLDPTLKPNRIKALLRDSDRPLTDSIDELSVVDAARRFFNDGGRLANQSLTPNQFIDPATGDIDYTRSSWSRSSWSDAGELLRSSWSRSSWRLAPETVANYAAAAADPTCSSWSRSSWSRSSWSTSWTK
jgi:serine protease AprX